MFVIMESISRRLVEHIEECAGGTSKVGIEAKDLCIKYTTDVIASVNAL